MDKNEVKKAAQNVSNKPFLVVLALAVAIICIIVVITLVKAVNSKIDEFSVNQTTTEVTQTEVQTTQPTNDLNVGTIKKYDDSIKNIYVTKEAARVAVIVEFTDEAALLEAHYAPNPISFDIVPVFCFYINNGNQVKVPGDIRLSSDGKSVTYYLSDINDISNAVAQTENNTVTLDNVLTYDFNVYLQHKTRDGVGRTILGTYAKNVEQFSGLYSKPAPKTHNVNDGIKSVDVTVTEEFAWIDIYFEDEDSYNNFSTNSGKKFMCFGFEFAGNLYKENFIVSEYKSLFMLRLKFDKYGFAELGKEINNKDVTLEKIFKDYALEIWATDYKDEISLLCLNDEIEVMDKLNNSMSTDDSTVG